MAQGMAASEGGSTAGSAAQVGIGLAMGQQVAQSFAAGQANPPAAPRGATPPPLPSAAPTAPGASAGLPELLSPADAARALGVSETDVMTALADGSLKGKKIGATWRITRASLDEFLKS